MQLDMAGRKGRKVYGSRDWQLLRLIVRRRDGWRCKACSRLGGRLEVDHIVPVSQGGAELDPLNLRTLCRECHLKKSAKERGESSVRLQDWKRKEWLDHIARRLEEP